MSESESKSTRKIKWISAKYGDQDALQALQKRMFQYYSQHNSYYDDISFAANNWWDKEQLPHQDILQIARNSKQILEVGCGEASILSCDPSLQERYTGVDFSLNQMKQNKARYPFAYFEHLNDVQKLPFKDESFDFVFSIFVIEHTVFPHQFLRESARVLQPGGTLCILCPNFLGTGRLSSQRVGFSQGTGREKLAQRKFMDAAMTAWDNKVQMPFTCLYYRVKSKFKSQFLINLQPTCFTDRFQADVDAVYVTYKHEIIQELHKKINWLNISADLRDFLNTKRLIYAKGNRK